MIAEREAKVIQSLTAWILDQNTPPDVKALLGDCLGLLHARVERIEELEGEIAVLKDEETAVTRRRWLVAANELPPPGMKVWVADHEDVKEDSVWWYTIDSTGMARALLPSCVDKTPKKLLQWSKYEGVIYWLPKQPMEIPPMPPGDATALHTKEPMPTQEIPQ